MSEVTAVPLERPDVVTFVWPAIVQAEARWFLIHGEAVHAETCWHLKCGCWRTDLELTGAVIRVERCEAHR